MQNHISEDTLLFLSELQENNNRIWFEENKPRYKLIHQEIKAFLANLVEEMSKNDQIEKSKVFRIYRDVRFSKDKTPYKGHIGLSMNRQKPALRGGYFLRIMPGNQSMLACGFWNPNPTDLRLIRDNIALDVERFEKAIHSKSVSSTYGSMVGDAVKTAPKGFDKNHHAIEWLRYKQFIFTKSFSDIEVSNPKFLQSVVGAYGDIRPFFDYMSDILTHNLNGEPLYT